MIAPTQTKTEHYIKIQGQNVPINLAPCGVKCIGCNQYYPKDKLQEHLNTHVNPQFIKSAPVFNAASPSKLNLAYLVEDPEKVQDIWVQSFLPADMPKPETQRKKVAKPMGEYHLLGAHEIVAGLNALEIDSKNDLASHIGDTIDESVQEVQLLNVRKKVPLNKVSNTIQKKQLRFYTNQNIKQPNYDAMRSAQKKIKGDLDTQDSDGYKVMQAPREGLGESGMKVGGIKLLSARQDQHKYLISSRAKNPMHALQISTLSKNDKTYLKPSQDWKERSRSTVIDGTSRVGDGEHNHMCPCCKGFYCSYCKSSVPPIYRPVPDKEGNYHFHPEQNQRAVQFYRDHYYPREDRNVCTHCSKEMVYSRIMQKSEQ